MLLMLLMEAHAAAVLGCCWVLLHLLAACLPVRSLAQLQKGPRTASNTRMHMLTRHVRCSQKLLLHSMHQQQLTSRVAGNRHHCVRARQTRQQSLMRRFDYKAYSKTHNVYENALLCCLIEGTTRHSREAPQPPHLLLSCKAGGSHAGGTAAAP
jgi:hypothetical protein